MRGFDQVRLFETSSCALTVRKIALFSEHVSTRILPLRDDQVHAKI